MCLGIRMRMHKCIMCVNELNNNINNKIAKCSFFLFLHIRYETK